MALQPRVLPEEDDKKALKAFTTGTRYLAHYSFQMMLHCFIIPRALEDTFSLCVIDEVIRAMESSTRLALNGHVDNSTENHEMTCRN